MDPWELVAGVTLALCLILLVATVVISHGQASENQRQHVINAHLLSENQRNRRDIANLQVYCGVMPVDIEQDEWPRHRTRR